MSKAEVDYTAALHSYDHDSRSIELGLVCAEHWRGNGMGRVDKVQQAPSAGIQSSGQKINNNVSISEITQTLYCHRHTIIHKRS